MVITLFDEARDNIPPEIPVLLLKSINSAFEDYNKNVSDSSRGICSPTTRANFINDHMIFRAKVNLGGHPDVKFIKKNGRTHLLICNKFEVKLKKLNANRRPSNLITQAVFEFNNQIPANLPYQYAFDEILNPITNLIAGYQLNRLKTSIEAVFIVCPEGKSNKWEWRLDFTEEPSVKSLPPSKPNLFKPKRKAVKPKSNSHERGIKGEAITKKGRKLQSRDAYSSETN